MSMIALISKLDQRRFNSMFSEDADCLEFLARNKWEQGFVCKKCGSTNYCHGKTAFSRRCTRCKHEESASAHTIFHGCKMPLKTAFEIAYLFDRRLEYASGFDYAPNDSIMIRMVDSY